MGAWLLVALVLAAAGLGFTAAHAAAAPGLEVGLQDDYVFVEQYHHGRESALGQARQLGVTRLRVNVRWAGVVRARRRARRRSGAATTGRATTA